LKSTLASLCDVSTFPAPPTASGHQVDRQALQHMVMRWKQHLEDGVFMLSVPEATVLGGDSGECKAGSAMTSFWTSPWPYWDMQTHANDLWKWFRGSGLVIFKASLDF
jgi:hypothetical protein